MDWNDYDSDEDGDVEIGGFVSKNTEEDKNIQKDEIKDISKTIEG